MNKIDKIIKEIELLIEDEPFLTKLHKDAIYKGKQTDKPFSIQTQSNKTFESMKKLEEDILNCRNCPLHKGRTKAVPGEGNYHSKIMIVGEGPGRDEDLQGRPFVGRAGQLLTKLLEDIGINRNEVYITNVVKCRPPENRTPTPEEIKACKPYLEKQFNIIQPKIVLLLGATACKAIIGEEKITKIRGETIEIENTIFLPTFHPAAVLRDETNKLPIIKQDFQKLKNLIEKLGIVK